MIQYTVGILKGFPTGIGVGLLFVFCVGSALLLTILGGKKGVKWSMGLMLVEYLFLILCFAVITRTFQASRTFNFTPFWSYRTVWRDGHELLLMQIIMNVVAFIPIGLLIGISFPKIKWWKVLLIGGAFSLLIEAFQFSLRRGFAEFDDVWHNVVGGMVGYGVFLALAHISWQSLKSLNKKP